MAVVTSSTRGTVAGAEISNANILSGSLSISMSTCGSEFTFGTFNSSVCKITLTGLGDMKSTDFSDAVLSLAKDSTSLGSYYIDDKKVERNGGVIKLVGYDAAVLFDVELPSSMRSQSYTASQAISAACQAVGVPLGSIPSTVGDRSVPNTDVTFTLASESIQSWRDVVMWCAQLLGCNAVISRNNVLEIRPALKPSSGSDYENTASMRQSVKFSDGKTVLKYLTAYSARQPKTYEISTSSAGYLPAAVSVPLNPLLDGKSETECDTINQAILNFLAYQGMRSITVKAVDDPSVSLCDTIKCTGGTIDTGAGIAGVATGIVWRYRGITTITCTAPTTVKEASV